MMVHGQNGAHLSEFLLRNKLEGYTQGKGRGLEKLSGNRVGQWSIRINDQWRICFRWEGSDAYDVEIADYH